MAVFRSVQSRLWLVYCPCCARDVGLFYLQGNAMNGAQAHAKRVHS